MTLAEAIHASTNAPVNYFDAPATFPDHPGRYWDGAIAGCNNPVLAAVTEAIAKSQAPTDLAVLSIGTASVSLPWPLSQANLRLLYLQQIVSPGFVPDLQKLATSILDDPPDIATFLAHVMTGSGIGLNKTAGPIAVHRANESTGSAPSIAPVSGRRSAWMSAAPVCFLGQSRHGCSSATASGRDSQVRRLVGPEPGAEPADTDEREYADSRARTDHISECLCGVEHHQMIEFGCRAVYPTAESEGECGNPMGEMRSLGQITTN